MKRILITVGLLLAVAAWACVAFLPIIMPLFGSSWSEAVGQWGDSFGALNALFSALAFVSVLYTLIQQQTQIDATADDQHLQRFEHSFFELLRLLREAREDVEYRYSGDYDGGDWSKLNDPTEKVRGLEAFKRAQFELKARAERLHEIHNSPPTKSDLTSLYEKVVLNRYESSFAPYYRLLFTILVRIKNDTKLSDEQKQWYGNLLRSQLSSHEVALCFYNGLSAVSGSFRELLAHFRIGKYLPKEFGLTVIKPHYPPEAFLGRDAAYVSQPAEV